MKKKALILGNLDPKLGVEKDINYFNSFLKSLNGGAWNDSEIDILKSPSKLDLQTRINFYKRLNLDYFVLLFGGHGDTSQGITHIYPSHKEKYDLSEEYFKGIAKKQLSIFDCCRDVRKTISENIAKLSTESVAMDSMVSYLTRDEVRTIYHNCINSAVEQDLRLYACSIGEFAQDDDGGLYTQNLISNAIQLSKGNERTVSAITVHQTTSPVVYRKSNGKQTPTYKGLIRVQEDRQLVFCVNPKRNLISW